MGVVDADAEDDEVGTDKAQVVGEGAFEVVRHRCTVDADGVVGDAGVAAVEQHAGEGELLTLLTGDDDVDGVHLLS